MAEKKVDPLVQPWTLGSHVVPGIWRYMLPYELAQLRIPKERLATCSDCPRTCTDRYRVDYRCCTYHPRVPNFLLGIALNHDGRARRAIEAVRTDGWLLPEAMQATPVQWADFLADVAEDRFGKSEDVLCPFLEPKSGFCNIYAFRNSVCSTFFCINDHGDRGHAFWENLQDLVMQVELAIGQWCMAELGFSIKAYIKCWNRLAPRVAKLHTKSKNWKVEIRKKVWGDWFGRELEFYRECGRLVSDRREELWEIACRTPICEAARFEQATHDVVPKKYQDEIEDDYDDDDEASTTSPRKLWTQVERAHRAMWRIPDRPLYLGERVRIDSNPKDDAESKRFSSKPVMVGLAKKRGGSKLQWREFVGLREKRALELFEKPTVVNHEVIQSIRKHIADPHSFISEWVGKRILIKHS